MPHHQSKVVPMAVNDDGSVWLPVSARVNELEPSGTEWTSVGAAALATLGALIGGMAVHEMARLTHLHVTSAESDALYVTNMVAAGLAIIASIFTALASNFGGWEVRRVRLGRAKAMAWVVFGFAAACALWRLITILIECQRAVDEKRVAQNSACWRSESSIRITAIQQAVGAVLMEIGLGLCLLAAKKRRRDIRMYLRQLLPPAYSAAIEAERD
ncbi:uncharacterized protein AMSG_03336 [Thecamonas trahens ATCC 50062]|uniref:Transmembrane protein n=1 Tax=Thecamonas trahens ATCC 50062 TaxID=461836 RepID=A0A0L0D3U1_THETB|nr:hypothetical protein AMSG_03336 [Thecamonas trahens ATCC 50062]KNC46905.1 hypothetical protein AMSG_03336 [Thecamonas trahens ATCC 50062]|eukprot:XP_013760178.1 hypothetical protein AMSG_03336 [Thecamonas trahens ATCC 50062]